MLVTEISYVFGAKLVLLLTKDELLRLSEILLFV